MDGSYGNVFPTGRAMPPSAPATNVGNQYKVNVNRQKTRKWANFKPQNYDGDDWGADYDDEPDDEPEPPLPPKPLGPRNQAASSPTARQFHPAGSPPLRTHAEQYAATGQSPGGPPRRSTEPFGASAHNTPMKTYVPFSPDRHGSPAPQSAPPLPSQLPSQKSGMGFGNVGSTLEATQHAASGAQPSNSPRPWMDARSGSPQSTGTPVSPNKPLPFVRPADVYQRMQEEREKEGLGPGGSATSGVPTQDIIHTVPSAATEDGGNDWNRNPASGLTPIAERQSEYGMEGVLASYGTQGPDAGPHMTQGQVESAEPQKSVQPLSFEDIRRFSTSPQLPDLTRMSGFGEDLFSSSSFFPASGLRSPVFDSTQSAMSGQYVPGSGESPAAAAQAASQSVAAVAPAAGPSAATHVDSEPKEGESQHVSGAGAGSTAGPSSPNRPDQDRPAEVSLQQTDAQQSQSIPERQPPAADVAREAASSTEEPSAAMATGPHLPGGWVTETPSTPGEQAGSPAPDASEGTDKAAEPTNAPHVDFESKVSSSDTSDSRQSEPQETGNSELDSVPMPLQPASPHSLPPLRTSSPTHSTKSGMSPQQQATVDTPKRDSPSAEALAAESGSAIPVSAATEQSEITPTAPLNPRRGSPDSSASTQHVLSPPPVPAEPTLEEPSHSPVKDSDVLSEEIIKSLSPVQPASGAADAGPGFTAAYQAAAVDPARESSYLGDVYGDYWSTSEDKADPGLLAVGKMTDTDKAAQEPSPLLAETREEGSTKPTDKGGSSGPSSPSRAAPVEVPDFSAGILQRRFSWEAPRDEPGSATESLAEQKALDTGAENVTPSATLGTSETGPSQPSQSSEAEKSAEDLRAEAAPEFNPAGTPVETPGSDRPIPSPSPLSDPTGQQGDSRRLSLAEEKIVLQEASHPVSPSPPPLEQHPAFADTRQPRQAGGAVPPSPENIINFRNIMEMSLASERIKNYNETRHQFSLVDTGLDDWLLYMVARHPEHANAILSQQGMAAHAQQGGGQGAAGQAAGSGGGGGGRSPVHLHMPHLQHGLSGLGHSGNQVGTKSKELLMAAGKAGKGLFSKGRNKLRGTGDKVFSSS